MPIMNVLRRVSKVPWWPKYALAITAGPFLGGFAGFGLLLFALLVYLLAPAEFVKRYGPFGPVALVYLKGGTLGGLLAGLVWPLTRWRIGALLAGICFMFPLYYYAGALLFGPEGKGTSEIRLIAGGLATVTGTILGFKLSKDPEMAGMFAKPRTP